MLVIIMPDLTDICTLYTKCSSRAAIYTIYIDAIRALKHYTDS